MQSYIKHITKLVDSILSEFHIVSSQRHMEIDNSKGIVGHLAGQDSIHWKTIRNPQHSDPHLHIFATLFSHK